MTDALWTEERLEIIRRDWPAGVRNVEIRAKLNALPGREVSRAEQVSDKALKLGLGRPEVFTGRLTIWTPERIEVLKRRWPTFDESADIVAEINALPGVELVHSQLCDKAKALKVYRPKLLKLSQITRLSKPSGRRSPHKLRHDAPPAPIVNQPARPTKSPIKVSLHVVYNQGFQLWQDGFLPVNKRDDLEAINKAIRLAEPGHPGFQLVTRWFGA